MKKVTKLMALLMAMVMILSGCMTQNDEITINADGTANMVQTVTLDKNKTDTTLSSLGYTEPSVLLKEMTGAEGDWKVITQDGKEYYQMISKTSYKKLKDLAYDSSGSFTNGLYITTDTIYGVTEVVSAEEYKSMGYDPSIIGTYTMELTFSKPVVTTNGIIDKENPNKVVFNVAMDKPTTIFATSSSGVTQDSVKKQVKAENTIKRPEIKSLKVTKVKGKKANVTLKVKKIKGVVYAIEYATNKKFTKNVGFKTTKKTKTVIKNLKKGKKYYFRVYALKENYAGLEISSKYSIRKSLKMVKKTKKSKKK